MHLWGGILERFISYTNDVCCIGIHSAL